MKKTLRFLFSRLFFIIVFILVQVLWIFMILYQLTQYSVYITWAVHMISIVIVFRLINKKINPSYQLAWIILIMAVPIFGAAIYFIFGKSRFARKLHLEFENVSKRYENQVKVREQAADSLILISGSAENQSRYLTQAGGSPLYQNTSTKYLSTGEEYYLSLLEELKKAKEYIFLEFFIIAPGIMWNSILEILEQKVKDGVDVRLIYDDMGCVNTLPTKYYKTLQKKGIKCAAFNPVRPILSVVLNNRDHRKIVVIDGHTGYTGGINLADEYINAKMRFGHWKDTAIRIKGEAVWSFTMMFLQMWEVITKEKIAFQEYSPIPYRSDGLVQPYCDTPLDQETVGENVYLNMIYHAKKYIYIFTPYLILDNEMMNALCLAAKSGVDVKIVTPHIPDKKMVFLLSQSYYLELLEAGVKIYEYTPGFLHAKSFVCDDELAVVGTVNLDYRSLFLHFECGVWMYKSRAVWQVKEDVMRVLDEATIITEEFCKNRSLFVRFIQNILRLFAPLL